jgi:hypothetical protein
MSQPTSPETMHRRDFLKTSGLVALISAAQLNSRASTATSSPASLATNDLLTDLIRANDVQIPAQLANQERSASHRWHGGIINEYGLHTVGGTANFISTLACALCAPGSKYFNAPELAQPLRLAVAYIIKAQHADGTVDYYATNFHSNPDMAFILELVCPACELLRSSSLPVYRAIADELGVFITRGANGLVTGGIHTPNHRWVVCSALALANALYPNPRYVARIDEWLAETIDLDPDGQFTEKSTTVYSPTVDNSLVHVARLLNRPALYEPVRRNLEMTLFYVHPDGEVVTEASRRQDRNTRGSMARYYYSYRALALHDGNGRFAAMCRQIEQTARAQISILPALLTQTDLNQPLPPNATLPTDYAKVFAYSNLARIRRGARSGTILASNTTLFSFRKGAAALEAVRCATAFFGKGQFIADALEPVDGRYVLRQKLDGPYFQPLSADQIAHGDHAKMAPNGTLSTDSRALRTRSNIQLLESVITISESAGKFTLEFSITGTDEVPVALELAFRHGGKLTGVTPVAHVNDAFLLSSGMGRYTVGEDTIEFGPGQASHTYTQVRGALPKWDGLSVYLTGLTPFKTTLTIG